LQLAIEFLKEIFESLARPAGGVSSISAKEIFEMAEQQGYKERTINRAKKEMGIISYQKYNEEDKRTWYWRINKDGDEKQNEFKFKKTEMPKLPDPKKLWS
jgi:hypothetical protein